MGSKLLLTNSGERRLMTWKIRLSAVITAMALLLPLASPAHAGSKCDEDFAMYMDHVRIYETALAQRNQLAYWSAMSGIGYLIGSSRSGKTRIWLARVETEMRAFRVGTYPFIAVQNRLIRGYC